MRDGGPRDRDREMVVAQEMGTQEMGHKSRGKRPGCERWVTRLMG